MPETSGPDFWTDAMPPIFHAETDFGTLIYIIIVFLWVIGNLVSRSKKKKQRGAPVPRAGESNAEKELREFLETISGQQVEPEPVAPPPPRIQRARERVKPRIAPPAPSIVHWREEPAPLDLEKMSQELRDGAPSMAGSFSTTLSSRGSLFKMAGITLPNFRYALSSTRPRPAVPIITHETLKSTDQIRRMMAGKVILGPPRALDPYTGDTDAMQMK